MQKDSTNNQRLLYLFMIFSALQSKSIKSHKQQIELLKGEGLTISAKQLGEHAKKIKEFIGTIQTKDQLIEKISRDNVSILRKSLNNAKFIRRVYYLN